MQAPEIAMANSALRLMELSVNLSTPILIKAAQEPTVIATIGTILVPSIFLSPASVDLLIEYSRDKANTEITVP